jgi:hypothetical protein
MAICNFYFQKNTTDKNVVDSLYFKTRLGLFYWPSSGRGVGYIKGEIIA